MERLAAQGIRFIAAWACADQDNPYQRRLPIATGMIQSQPAAVYDLFRTILALADIPLPKGHVIDGARLDTLLAGKSDDTRPRTFLMHYPHAPHRSNYYHYSLLNGDSTKAEISGSGRRR